MESIPEKNGKLKPRRRKFFLSLDRWLMAAGLVVLAALILTMSRANIMADSVDYYAILQWVTPAEEKPIVGNLHFAEQRSPGYSLTALIPYGLLSLIVEPFVQTEKIVQSRPARPFPRPEGRGSELRPIPEKPLRLLEVPFKDFYISHEGSWYQWKLVLALALTSYFFLFIGLAANFWALRLEHSTMPGYSLVPLAVFASPVFMQNILNLPLYATLTAYGGMSLFTLYFLKAHASGKALHFLLAGMFLGLVVLVRLETSVLGGALILLLAVRREWRACGQLALGASWALAAWASFNLTQFGTPFHLGILRGDINVLAFDPGYIYDNLIHPASGAVFWSPLLIPGIIGLLFSRKTPLRMMGISSLVLLALYLIRVPIMYQHAGEDFLNIGGVPVTVPPTSAALHGLVRSDINRYVTVLLPFSLLGLREGIGSIRERWFRIFKRTAAAN